MRLTGALLNLPCYMHGRFSNFAKDGIGPFRTEYDRKQSSPDPNRSSAGNMRGYALGACHASTDSRDRPGTGLILLHKNAEVKGAPVDLG